MVWADEFDSFDGTVWRREHSTYGDGNGELQCYRPENVAVAGGALILRARTENYTCPNGSTRDVTSGMVRGRVDFDHGQRIEFRVKVNPRDPVDQRGLWPALWASSWNGRGWPRGGEVDWLEYVGKEPTRAHHTIHYPGTDGRRAKTPKAVELGERFSDSWHVIAFDWTDDLVWYIDGREVQRIPAADVEATDNPFLESANPVQIRTRPRRPSGVLTSIQAMWCGLRRNVLVRAATGFGAVLLALTAGAACTSSPERVDTLSDASKLMTDDVGESTTTSTTGSAAAGDSEARQALAVTVDVETEPGDTTDTSRPARRRPAAMAPAAPQPAPQPRCPTRVRRRPPPRRRRLQLPPPARPGSSAPDPQSVARLTPSSPRLPPAVPSPSTAARIRSQSR